MWDAENNRSYENVAGADDLPTNQTAYHLVNWLGFDTIFEKFPDTPIRVCDVGCYLGYRTHNIWRVGQTFQGNFQMLGTDIFEENIQVASQKFAQPNLQFVWMEAGHPIPLIDNQPYHLILATFVLDAILDFEAVKALCVGMMDALLNNGELFLLRLHPNALSSNAGFAEYEFPVKPLWRDNDDLIINIVTRSGKKTEVIDKYWNPETIGALFAECGCTVEYIPIVHDMQGKIGDQLRVLIAEKGLDIHNQDWSVPLFQIIRICKP